MFQPQVPGDEEFHLGVTELLDEWANRHETAAEAVQVIGERWSQRSQELRDMFVRNRVPTGFHDASSPKGRELLASLGLVDPELAGGGAPVPPGAAGAGQSQCVGDRQRVRPAGLGGRSRRVRRGGDRRRTRRAERSGVRLVGGPAHGGAGAAGHGRPGRLQLADPQLPRLPARDQRRPAGGERVPAGVGVRHDVPVVPVAGQHHGRGRPAGAAAVRRRRAAQPDRGRGHRSRVAAARGAGGGGPAGPRRLLRGGGQRGPGDDREAGLRARRRQLRRAGRGLPVPVRRSGHGGHPPAAIWPRRCRPT